MRSSLRALAPELSHQLPAVTRLGIVVLKRQADTEDRRQRPAHLRRQPILEGASLLVCDSADRQVGLRHRESHLQLVELLFHDLDPLAGSPEPFVAQARSFLGTNQLPSCLLQLLEKLRVLRGGLEPTHPPPLASASRPA